MNASGRFCTSHLICLALARQEVATYPPSSHNSQNMRVRYPFAGRYTRCHGVLHQALGLLLTAEKRWFHRALTSSKLPASQLHANTSSQPSGPSLDNLLPPDGEPASQLDEGTAFLTSPSGYLLLDTRYDTPSPTQLYSHRHHFCPGPRLRGASTGLAQWPFLRSHQCCSQHPRLALCSGAM